MNFKEFIEMSLKNYRVEPNGFEPVDVKVMLNPATQRNLEARLKTSTNFDFNILLLGFDYSLGKDQFLAHVMDYMKKENIPLENHITFAKNGSTGEPLTAWMIPHTIGHAISFYNKSIFIKILRIIEDICEKRFSNYKTAVLPINLAASLFKFRSARVTAAGKVAKQTLLNFEELICDLVAEYLTYGKIRADVPVNQIEELIHGVLSDCVGKIITDFR